MLGAVGFAVPLSPAANVAKPPCCGPTQPADFARGSATCSGRRSAGRAAGRLIPQVLTESLLLGPVLGRGAARAFVHLSGRSDFVLPHSSGNPFWDPIRGPIRRVLTSPWSPPSAQASVRASSPALQQGSHPDLNPKLRDGGPRGHAGGRAQGAACASALVVTPASAAPTLVLAGRCRLLGWRAASSSADPLDNRHRGARRGSVPHGITPHH